MLPGGRDKDTAQRRGRHTHAVTLAHARTHTVTHTNTLRDGSKKTPSHRNLRGRVGGRDRESERSGKKRNGRGERALEEGDREPERERDCLTGNRTDR